MRERNDKRKDVVGKREAALRSVCGGDYKSRFTAFLSFCLYMFFFLFPICATIVFLPSFIPVCPTELLGDGYHRLGGNRC